MDHSSALPERKRSLLSNSISQPPTRSWTFRRNNEESPSRIGRLGLNTVHNPEYAIADIIFIHGLGGGSRKTWSKNAADPTSFWPGEWLPNDMAFKKTRIHTFGYESNWDKSSILNIHDFSKSLLEWVSNSSTIPLNATEPLILVCHSLGGLVAKKAFVLSKQLPEYQSFAKRVKAIFFLATPHGGSAFADTLKKVLLISPGARPFVSELQPNSAALAAINEEFPRHCNELYLFSFYETLPMHFSVLKGIIVPKQSAILNYHNERSTYLTADHREVCKFSTQEDANYRKVRDALASTLDAVTQQFSVEVRKSNVGKQNVLRENLKVTDLHTEEFQKLASLRVSGSCEWITDHATFCTWRDTSDASLFWLTANPGTGKSVLTTRVIDHLREENRACSFFFFTYGDTSKASPIHFLHSLAWQMSQLEELILDFLFETYEKEPYLERADARSFWHKIFIEGIFKLGVAQQHFWIVDGFDECKHSEILSWLLKAAQSNAVRLFVTCRDKMEIYGEAVPKGLHVVHEVIPINSTKNDISKFLSANLESIPASEFFLDDSGVSVTDQILQKSGGSFLWARVVIQELRSVFTEVEAQQVLKEVPTEMDPLYGRIFSRMSSMQRGKDLAKAILVWTACASRPLNLNELYDALRLDIKQRVEGLERAITTTCGQLVQVDPISRVQMVHQTAREFLFKTDSSNEFRISRQQGHARLGAVCLRFLCGPEITGGRSRKLSARAVDANCTDFMEYACESFFEHIRHVTSEDDDFRRLLIRFLMSSNVLYWIEWIALHSKLEKLIQAGRAIRYFVQRRRAHSPIVGPLANDTAILEGWAIDLVRLVTKFGRKLISNPSSIHFLIPPFCPKTSAIYKQFGSRKSLNVRGLTSDVWDDCVSTLAHQGTAPLVAACGVNMFSFGMRNGHVKIYSDETCQSMQQLSHDQPIHSICFGTLGILVAVATRKQISIWDISSSTIIHQFDVEVNCSAMAFVDSDRILLVALRNSTLWLWNLQEKVPDQLESWVAAFYQNSHGRLPHPATVDFIEGGSLVAVAYRGYDVIVWDVESDTIHDIYGVDQGSLGTGAFGARRSGVTSVHRLCFARGSGRRLLAGSTGDATIFVIDIDEGSLEATVPANVTTMVSSPNGLLLATGNSGGTIQIWDFESLRLLHSIHSGEELTIRDLAFCHDGLRLVDIRGTHCRVWDPPVLIPKEVDDDFSDTISVTTMPIEQTADEAELTSQISAFTHSESLQCIFCGRLDGVVAVYDAKTGEHRTDLFCHRARLEVTQVAFEEKNSILVSIEISGQLLIHKVNGTADGGLAATIMSSHTLNAPVRQIMLKPDGITFILTYASKIELWSLKETEHTCTKVFEHEPTTQYWINHPLNEDLLMQITGNTVHLFTWNNLERTTTAGILLNGVSAGDMEVSSAHSCCSGLQIVMSFTSRVQKVPQTATTFWPSLSFQSDELGEPCEPLASLLSGKIETVLGSHSQRLVFVDPDGWVCSANPQQVGRQSHDKHFFFPSDWLAAMGKLMACILPDGDIAIVQRHELAIIKGGLDQLEKETTRTPRGSVAEQRPGFNKLSLSEDAFGRRRSLSPAQRPSLPTRSSDSNVIGRQ